MVVNKPFHQLADRDIQDTDSGCEKLNPHTDICIQDTDHVCENKISTQTDTAGTLLRTVNSSFTDKEIVQSSLAVKAYISILLPSTGPNNATEWNKTHKQTPCRRWMVKERVM
jgi:hypothetical protein